MPYTFTNPLPDYAYRFGSLFLGHDGQGDFVGVDTEIHAVTVGGTGAGKGACLLVQNAMRWPQNLVCIDPKGQNVALTWETREALGHKVAVLDPFKIAPVPERLRAGFNPLTGIDPAAPFARATISAIANGLVVVHDPRHMEWVEGARKLLAGVCAYVVANYPPAERSLTMMRDILMTPDELPDDEEGNPQGLHAIAQYMAQGADIGGLARAAGIAIQTALTSSKGMEKDFLSNARRATDWLDDEGIAATLSRSTIDLSDLKRGNLSLYLVLPADPDIMATYAPFLRLAVKASLNAMTGGSAAAKIERRCLFLLDEFYSLGRLEEIIEGSGRLRDYGAHLWPFVQTLSQLHRLYDREGAQILLSGSDALVFLGIDKDDHSLEYVSRRIGNLTPEEVAPPFEPELPPAPSRRYTANYINAHGFGVTVLKTASRIGANDEEKEKTDVLNAENDYQYQNAMQAAQHTEARRKAQYEHAMRKVGSRRLTPEDVAALVGKGHGDKVARSIIVFAKAGDILNIKPAPYFLGYDADIRQQAAARKAQKPRTESRAKIAAEWGERAARMSFNEPPRYMSAEEEIAAMAQQQARADARWEKKSGVKAKLIPPVQPSSVTVTLGLENMTEAGNTAPESAADVEAEIIILQAELEKQQKYLNELREEKHKLGL